MDGQFIQVFAGYAALAAMASRWSTAEHLMVLAIPLAAGAATLVLNARDKRAARRAKAAALAARPRPQWAIALLVDADEESGILRPTVQVLGPPLPAEISVELRVGDERGEVRLASRRSFNEPSTRTDLMMGTLALPDSVPAARAALCDWTVVVSHDGREIARRCGPLAAAPYLNEEGELQAPDLEPEPEMVEPPPAIPDPVRHKRWTIGMFCLGCGCAMGGYVLTTLSAWLWLAAVPLFLLAVILLVAAAVVLYTPCPLCGRLTTVAGRTGVQRCDACSGAFSLTPGSV